jgi:hypothetical protein
MQVLAIVVSLLATLVAVALVAQTAGRIVATVRLGQPDPTRRGDWAARTREMLVETLGHTRMLKWSVVGAAHWFVFVGFGLLFFTLVEAYGELFSASFHFPWVLATWSPYEPSSSSSRSPRCSASSCSSRSGCAARPPAPAARAGSPGRGCGRATTSSTRSC